jgi:hypothetical protein
MSAVPSMPASEGQGSPEMSDLFDFGSSTRIKVSYLGSPEFGSVSPHAMALASPVWKKLIFPSHAQNGSSDVKASKNEINVDEDGGENPDEMAADDESTLRKHGLQNEIEEDEGDDAVAKADTGGQNEADAADDEFPASKQDTESQNDVFTPQSASLAFTIEPVDMLDFSEANGEALLILLCIVHYKFTDVPAALKLEILYEVAVVCDKYDCAHLVKPWLAGWLKEDSAPWKEISAEWERWLFIAWTFGRERILYEVASLLVLDIMTYKSGQCLSPRGRLGPMPPGLIGEYPESFLICYNAPYGYLILLLFLVAPGTTYPL